MKKLFKILVLILVSFSLLTGCNLDNKVDENKKAVEEQLAGFYDDSYGKYEIHYGESTEDMKDKYLEETKDFYTSQKYEEILKYNIENDITVIKNNN